MADISSLLVPIPVQALLVNARVASDPFERWTNVWGNLNIFTNPIPPPWGNTAPVAQGVHLHWKLPTALTHGHAPDGTTSAEFPLTPNRWIVVRLASTTGAVSPQTMTAWIIESDYLDPNDGSTPYIDPSSTPTNLQTTLLGRNMQVQQWTGNNTTGELFLTATGIAESTFTAYQPGLIDVYAFFDDTTGLPENTLLTYLVAGWYSDPASDPLVLHPAFDAQHNIFTDLDWLVLGDTGNQTPPTQSVYHGLVYDLLWQTSTVPARVDSDADSMQVAVGYTAIDALAAIIANADKDKLPAPAELEMMLEAFQYDRLQLLDEPDATAQLELKIRQGWFGSTPGGTLWDITQVSQGQTTSDPLSREPETPQPPLTDEQAIWLAALNQSQRQFDVAQRELKTMQWELFSLWWKAQYIENLVPDGLNQLGINANQIQTWLDNATDPGQSNSYYNQVVTMQASLSAQQENLPDPTSQTSIDLFSQKIPGNTDGKLVLKPRSMPSFYHPVDPVVLVAGITPPTDAVDDSQPLPCRLSTAATTGVNVQTSTTVVPVNSATGTLAQIIQNPTTLPTNNNDSTRPLSSLLAPAVSAAIQALAVEAFFVDSNNAASIVSNGLSSTDQTVIADLQTAMTNATAQFATIPQPLRASFAFEQWQQAWSPLFLEWNLQFYPTVEANFTGQALPPQQAVPAGQSAVQDNLPMDLSDWSFNGSDNVTERGSEYYSWTGGDIWTQTDWLVPQDFIGRTFLTPNAENLFIKRLIEYIKTQPAAAATAVITNGVVTSLVINNGGSGYTSVPTVTLSGGGGSGATAVAEISDGVISSLTVTSGGSGYASAPIVAISEGDWSAIQDLIDQIGETRFLSQALSGFNDNFLMKQQMHSLSPDDGTASVIEQENRSVPNPGLGNVPIKFGTGQPFFFPARGGFFSFKQLQIVDGFGQVLDLLNANGNAGGGGAATFQPILGAGLVPDSAIASQTYQIKQAPRVVQPSRLNLRLLDAFDDSEEVFLSPGTNPVCGWFLPNHLDHSIAVYDAAGNPLGELLVLMQSGGTNAVKWLPAPDSPEPITDPSQIKNPHLSAALTQFTSTTGGLPVEERVSAFKALFNSIDETLWTTDPPGGQGDKDLAALIGRPLAVVRAQLQFELYGLPASNQSWRDTFDLSNPNDQTSIEAGQQDAGFTALPFPIRLGSTELLNDGLIGYFIADTYTTFNAVHAASSPPSTYVQPIGGTNYISLPFNCPAYTTQNLTLLLDPLGSVHATTGILPVAQMRLPSQFYASALAQMAVTFRIGPLLTDPNTIRIPLPAEQQGVWSWVWQTAPNQYAADNIVVANQQARLADSPPHLMEGWLKLSPKSTSSK